MMTQMAWASTAALLASLVSCGGRLDGRIVDLEGRQRDLDMRVAADERRAAKLRAEAIQLQQVLEAQRRCIAWQECPARTSRLSASVAARLAECNMHTANWYACTARRTQNTAAGAGLGCLLGWAAAVATDDRSLPGPVHRRSRPRGWWASLGSGTFPAMTHAPSPPSAPTAGSRKSVLLIGLAPHAVDFSKFPDLDEARLTAGLQAALEEVVAAGFDATWCLTESTWESVEPQVSACLAAKRYDAVMIGAGVRTVPEHLVLFERILNLVHAAAPGAKLCFNTRPDTTLAAIRRWIEP